MKGTAYIYKATGHFAFISDTPRESDELQEVPSLPPNAKSRWNGSGWVALTDAEIATEEPAEGELDQNVEFPVTVIKNSVPLWGNESAAKLIGSNIALSGSTLNIPHNVNLVGEYGFFINSENINTSNISTSKDRQRAVEITDDSHSLNSWELVSAMTLKSANTSTSLYKIEIELLLYSDADGGQLEVALFVNGQQQSIDTLNINFSHANDSKIFNWSLDDLTWGECLVLLGSVVGLNMDFFAQNMSAMNLKEIVEEKEPKRSQKPKDGGSNEITQTCQPLSVIYFRR